MWLFTELKRRNVFRVAAAYVVASWLLIQVAETIFPLFGFNEGPARVVVIILAIGFPILLIFSWLYELTPEGLRLEKDVDRSASVVHHTGKNLDRAIIIVLALSLGYFAFDKFVLAPERLAEREAEVAEQAKAEAITGYYGDRSIAVLPFNNLSADPEQQYFVDGVTEELLNLLAKIRQLRVISRSSSFALRDLDLEVPEIAERLDVAHILEGSVRKVGNTVRVTAQLIEARTDTHLWSKTYERELENVFAIQDEIAADVANNLKIELLRPLPASRMIAPEAVALTLQARMIGERLPIDAGTRMTEFVDRAIEVDPGYVAAWEQKVWADFLLMREGQISAEEEKQRYRESRRRILELDPESGFVDSIDGVNEMEAERYEEAASLFERSISKDPNRSEPAQLAGGFARELGKFDTAIRLGEHSVAIDPLCFFCLWQLSRTYLYAGDYDAAAEMRGRYLALGGGGANHYGLMLLLQGKASEALEQFQAFDSTNPYKFAGLAMAYHDLGERSSAEDELTRLMSTEDDYTEVLVAKAAAWMGERDIAFEWLKKAADEEAAINLNLMDPTLQNLHEDPRWDEFLESVGFSPARLDAIKFNPVLPE